MFPTSHEAAPMTWRQQLPSPGTKPPKERLLSPSSFSSLWQPPMMLELINEPTTTQDVCSKSRQKKDVQDSVTRSLPAWCAKTNHLCGSLTSFSSRGVSVIGFVENERRGLVFWVADLGSNKSGAATVRKYEKAALRFFFFFPSIHICSLTVSTLRSNTFSCYF